MKIRILDINSELLNKSDMAQVEYKGLLDIINNILDWDNCEFPSTLDLISEENPKTVENRDFLGNPPKLVPGVIFIYKKQQLIFLDENTLGLVNTETGVLGLYRVINDFILPEYKLRYQKTYINSVCPDFLGSKLITHIEPWLKAPIYQIEELEITELSEFPEQNNSVYLKIPVGIYELLQFEQPIVKISVKSEIDIFDKVNLIFDASIGRLYYSTDEIMDDTHIMSEILSTISYLINKKETKD